jgi:hypothetical protein
VGSFVPYTGLQYTSVQTGRWHCIGGSTLFCLEDTNPLILLPTRGYYYSFLLCELSRLWTSPIDTYI